MSSTSLLTLLDSGEKSFSKGSASYLAMNQIENPSLLTATSFDSSSFPIHNPARPDEIVGYALSQTRQDVQRMVQRAHTALPSWRDDMTNLQRSKYLRDWSQLIEENKNDIARIMTLESGKPFQESLGEVDYARSFLDYYAAESLRSTAAGGGSMIPTPFSSSSSDPSPRGHILVTYQAVGVCALLTPWNFPAAMVLRKVAPALASGCNCIVKPAQQTPLTALALQSLAFQAGIPEMVLQVVTCHSSETTKEVGEELTTNPLVRKVSFTGSTAVGKLLLKQSADTVKRVSMELGGNAPFIVFGDANMDIAVREAVSSKFRHAGQTCVCADRFLVHTTVYEEFCRRVVEHVTRNIVVGDGMEDGTTMGPLISSSAVEKVHDRVQTALREGAECLAGGEPLSHLGPNYYKPTVLTNVSPQSDIWKEETFGPVMPIIKFETDEEALSLAHDSNVGLAGYICTSNLSRIFALSKSLECGMIGVNEGIISTAVAPFGGIKESGLGREGSTAGLAEYLETKYVMINA